MKKLDGKDETMVSDLFCHILLEKGSCIDILESEMSKLPFSGGFGGVALSLSIAGASALEHAYFEPFIKIEAEIITIKSMLREIEDSLPKYIEEGVSDWTITMRKFAKIDHVIKVAYETLNFISNALRKQKISETYQASEELSFIMSSSVLEDKSTRKGSEDFGDSEMLKKSSVSSFMKIRKETNLHLLETDLDTLMKKMKKMRYLRFQGTYLYYPIANIDDAVSLLTCFLNTDEFRESLKEPTYRDEIIMKLPFTKEMKNDWKPFLEVKKVYRDLTKEEYGGWGESQDIEFSVYYHREFEELRTSEGIGFRLFIRSLYGCQSWDSSGGKSNSCFSKAHNETLVVKIINDK